MVLQMRGTVTPTRPWEVMVDLFFYREPDETKDREEEEGGAADFTAPEYVPPPALTADATEWTQDGQWEAEGGAAPPAVIPPAAAPAEWAQAPPPAGWDPAAIAPASFVPPSIPAASGWEAAPPAAPSGWETQQ